MVATPPSLAPGNHAPGAVAAHYFVSSVMLSDNAGAMMKDAVLVTVGDLRLRTCTCERAQVSFGS